MNNSSTYHFITHWQVNATCQEAYTIITHSETLTEWWPSVYLDLKVLEKGDEDGIGKIIELFTKGWLPYTLRWKFRVKDSQANERIEIEAIGDFVGRGIWTFNQEGEKCHIQYDWKIEAEKPLLKKMSFLMKPVFAANHHWAMQKGLESLALELERKQGKANVPSPPKPVFPHNLTNNKIL